MRYSRYRSIPGYTFTPLRYVDSRYTVHHHRRFTLFVATCRLRSTIYVSPRILHCVTLYLFVCYVRWLLRFRVSR